MRGGCNWPSHVGNWDWLQLGSLGVSVGVASALAYAALGAWLEGGQRESDLAYACQNVWECEGQSGGRGLGCGSLSEWPSGEGGSESGPQNGESNGSPIPEHSYQDRWESQTRTGGSSFQNVVLTC